MSVDFMSAEVARMTLTANAGLGVPKSGSKKKAPANLARRASQASESNDVLVRRTLVHRAIKRMRSEARTAGRAWLTNTLKRGDSVEGAEFVDKDEGGERVDDMIAAAAGGEGEDTPQGDAPKSVMGVAVRILAVSSAYKKLKRVAAKSSWYSEYQEQHNYEHRVQKDGFQFIVEYKAHFGNVGEAHAQDNLFPLCSHRVCGPPVICGPFCSPVFVAVFLPPFADTISPPQ